MPSLTKSVRTRNELNAAFEDFLDVAELMEIRLVSSNLKSHAGSSRSPGIDAKLTHSCEISSVQYDPDQHLLIGFVDAAAGCRCGRKTILSLKAEYVVIYSVSGEPSEDVSERFFRVVGQVAVYPYFRTHFAEIAAQAGFRMPPLPIFRTPRRSMAAWAKVPKSTSDSV